MPLPIGMRPVPGTLIKQFTVYILTNRPRGVLYVGLSSDLPERIRQHREKLIPGFTKRYNLTHLAYYEHLPTAEHMINREKRLKRWHRDWKIELIEKMNPTWRDLWPDITGEAADAISPEAGNAPVIPETVNAPVIPEVEPKAKLSGIS